MLINLFQALINISTGCEQKIVHDCTANALTNYAWWNDRNGNKIEYWDGDYESSKQGCECSHSQNSCDRNFKKKLMLRVL